MRTVILSVYVLFLGSLLASATRWSWNSPSNADDQQHDGPEMLETPAPAVGFHNGRDYGFPPHRSFIGRAIYPNGIYPLEARQQPNCTTACGRFPCCNGGEFCCETETESCGGEGTNWCCPTSTVACPGSENACRSDTETCCGSGVCSNRVARCCGGQCCALPNTCNDSNQCVDPSATTTTTTTTSSSTSSTSSTVSSSSTTPDPQTTSTPPPQSTSTPDPQTSTTSTPDPQTTSTPDPQTDTTTAPADTTAPAQTTDGGTVVPFIATANLGDSTTALAQTPTPTTIVTHGSILVVTPAIQSNAGITTQQAQADSSDAVALVKPWDPRIIYSPDNAWIDTSSSSSTGTTSSSAVGSCHNGTRVANQVGATIKFPFEGKEIAVLIVDGSKAGDYSIQIDGNPASTLSGYKDPGTQGDQCLYSQPFTSTEMPDAQHTITITIKGSSAGGTGGTQVEFGGFIYRGSHAVGTSDGSKKNIGAIVGGTVGGVVGGIAIIAIIIVVIVLRRRRNQRLDTASAVDQTSQAAPTRATTTPYSAVATTEYHDPYANAGLGPQHYPNPAVGTSQQPRWAQTNQGPFGSGSFAAGSGAGYYAQ